MEPDFPALSPPLPAHWQDSLAAQSLPALQPLSPRAWIELDLDAGLRFNKSLLLINGDFLVWVDGTQCQSWLIQTELDLSHSDHAGVGCLRLQQGDTLLATWHYTLAVNPQALRLLAAFQNEQHASQTAFSLLSDEDAVDDKPPSTWTLLKLWRFARPYKKELLLGFILTLASTGATLVPPYLTMPLMDNILIPYERGQPIDFDLARLYLGALLAAAVLAWGLGWWRTYLLALVSERIGADLRNTTFEHLLKLSLEYFGGKRTGDLIARIGVETDRICVFLSLYLLDFLTDLIMIIMTAAILASIDPLLALVTLAPLPFIAWMIHVVRDKLRYGFEKIDRIWGEVTNVLTDTIPGIRVVKAFAQEKRELKRFVDSNRHNLQINDRVNRVWGLFTPTVTLLTEVGLLVVWAFGIWQVANRNVSVGVLIAFLAYIGRFYIRLDSMSRIVSHTQKAAAGAKRIFDILDHVSSVPEPVNPAPLGPIQGKIDLRGVGFR